MRTFLLIFLITSMLVSSCETDLNIVNPAPPTPVVFCILDQDSPVQYLRLSRSYISGNGTIPPDETDSLLFARDTKVVIEEMVNGKVTNQAFFLPVDMGKDSGFFPSEVNWNYRAEFTVKPGTDYRLIVYIDDFDKIVYSTCYTVGKFDILNPLYPEVRYIHMLPDHNLSFYWTKSSNAAIYQIAFQMHYLEMGEDETIEKKILIPLKSIFYLETTENKFSYPVNSTSFYNYLARELPVDPMVLRKFLSIDAIIISGGEELGYYMQIQESGQAFTLMDYSNITNGIGIFSSKVLRKIDGFSLTDQSIDTLAYGHATKDLNFVDRTGTRSGFPTGLQSMSRPLGQIEVEMGKTEQKSRLGKIN